MPAGYPGARAKGRLGMVRSYRTETTLPRAGPGRGRTRAATSSRARLRDRAGKYLLPIGQFEGRGFKDERGGSVRVLYWTGRPLSRSPARPGLNAAISARREARRPPQLSNQFRGGHPRPARTEGRCRGACIRRGRPLPAIVARPPRGSLANLETPERIALADPRLWHSRMGARVRCNSECIAYPNSRLRIQPRLNSFSCSDLRTIVVVSLRR